MKDAILATPPQRAVALTTIAQAIFSPQYVNEALDSPREQFNGLSAIQHARKGLEEFRQAQALLQAGVVFA